MKNNNIYSDQENIIELLDNLPINQTFSAKVISNSMLPIFKKNDLVLIIKIKFNKIKKNDIIAFINTKKEIVVHRVIKKNKNSYITKGDNNNKKDKLAVNNNNFLGKIILINHKNWLYFLNDKISFFTIKQKFMNIISSYLFRHIKFFN